jgi:cytochrome bd-type quinol oxidase subunit 2
MTKTRSNFPLAAVPFAVLGSFILCFFAASVVVSQFTNWWEPFVGPCCAITVIVVTFWLSPTGKRTLGLVTLLLGMFAAWLWLMPSYYPEHHPKAYQTTAMPFVATVGAGLLSYLLCSTIWPKEKSCKDA